MSKEILDISWKLWSLILIIVVIHYSEKIIYHFKNLNIGMSDLINYSLKKKNKVWAWNAMSKVSSGEEKK